jgi:hypothetical protein
MYNRVIHSGFRSTYRIADAKPNAYARRLISKCRTQKKNIYIIKNERESGAIAVAGPEPDIPAVTYDMYNPGSSTAGGSYLHEIFGDC